MRDFPLFKRFFSNARFFLKKIFYDYFNKGNSFSRKKMKREEKEEEEEKKKIKISEYKVIIMLVTQANGRL